MPVVGGVINMRRGLCWCHHVQSGPQAGCHVVLSADHVLRNPANAVGAIANGHSSGGRHTRAVGTDRTSIGCVGTWVTETWWRSEVKSSEGTRLAEHVSITVSLSEVKWLG